MKKIGIPREISTTEKRVAATAETVAKMRQANLEIYVEADAGRAACISNEDYQQAGAHIIPSRHELYQQVDAILQVQTPTHHDSAALNEIETMRDGMLLIAPLAPSRHPQLLEKIKAKKITAFALDLVPRIARAQAMDILSSMSNLAGYKSVLLAADHLGKIFPMLTTAAGTIQPAKIIVIGAGVAGLQAIATARRLGGVVIAFDTRPVVAEQVKSLGAEFVSLETTHEQAQDAGGYAREQSVEFYQHEQGIIAKYSKEADVIITTALIPGKRAPILLTKQMVHDMKPGSVIVDLAAEQQGNCELTKPGEITQENDVTIIGLTALPSLLPVHATQLYARNMWAFLQYILPSWQAEQWDREDEILRATMIA